MDRSKKKITIIGGGPSGLFCAYQLLKKGHAVDLYDQMSSPGKKFLVAGNGGLNLTHSEDLSTFSTRYGKNSDFFKELIRDFSPKDLQKWSQEIGVETFIGSSGRIFPKELKAGLILKKWLDLLKSNEDFNLFLKHQFIGFNKNGALNFKYKENTVQVDSKPMIFALGGASWEKTGSDGKWGALFDEMKIKRSPFLPMNSGFERTWSKFFISKVNRSPLKNIALSIGSKRVKGEIMLTPFGAEGGAIYALSSEIREEISKKGKGTILLDFRPNMDEDVILEKLEKRERNISLSNYLRKSLNLNQVSSLLLYELLSKEEMNNNNFLAEKIKSLPIEFYAPRPLSEAISTSGGVCFSELSKNLEVLSFPGIYIAGEMLDFEAPTGGYLLQGCFSSAMRIVEAISSE